MQDKLFSVDGQVVLVSGGSRGIGRALAQGFADRDAQVIIAGREAETLAATAQEISHGTHPVAYEVCDVAKPEEVAALVASVIEKYGRIDTLVSVAGVNKRMKAEALHDRGIRLDREHQSARRLCRSRKRRAAT